MVGTARSIEITKVSYHAWQLKSRVPMLPLVRCATISRQLGQGRQRSGGSPLFMINHRSSHRYRVLLCCVGICVSNRHLKVKGPS